MWVLTEEEVTEPPRMLKEALRKRWMCEEGVFQVCDMVRVGSLSRVKVLRHVESADEPEICWVMTQQVSWSRLDSTGAALRSSGWLGGRQAAAYDCCRRRFHSRRWYPGEQPDISLQPAVLNITPSPKGPTMTLATSRKGRRGLENPSLVS